MIEPDKGGHAIKRSRYTEEQIAFALKQAELGTPVPEVWRKIGISDAKVYAWRKKKVANKVLKYSENHQAKER